MFGLFCKGLHCAGCKSAGVLPLVAIVILCLILTPSIERVIGTAIIIGCSIIGGTMILSAIAYAVVSKICERHMVYVRGQNFLTIEGRNGHGSIRTNEVTDSRYPQIPSSHVIPILPRQAYEWQADRQFYVLERRDER